MSSITYKAEDIFEDITGDTENVMMNIPPEIAEELGWKPGDVLKIYAADGSIVIEKIETE